MAVRRGKKPLAAKMADSVPPPTREARLALHVTERSLDRMPVRPHQRRRGPLVGNRKQHADALRRRERQVKRSHLRPPVLRPKALTGTRIATAHRAHERVAVDLAGDADYPGPAADPTPRRLPPAGEVILHTLRNLLLVVSELVR
jgi:hypothetical protein